MTSSLLFDLDGTIAETDHLHFEAFNSVLTPHGVTIDWDIYKARVIGRNNPEIAAEFLPHVAMTEHAEIMERKEATYRERILEIEAASGLTALLDWADAKEIPCAVVTNAPRLNADAVLDALMLRHRFKIIVIGPELAQAKPHPLPYLTALDALGAAASTSVAFEDSRAGIASAVAAKLGVVGLATSFDPATLVKAGAAVAGADFRDPAILAYVQQRLGV
ncbi:HAD family hydrolase [Lichenifustis flavocetrariae]|uniref:HAD family phosphatase n=1 Tax=Lichenifustis flavocetrariae TaxID=2949735 RepID=A0AA41YUI4_9HYPH|nr:HAD family phosphatase [Lichenifustis flavocetrariae]MCW6508379.1 HAD family phosphatase [Lichenifustis flavocetrariae]